MVGRELVERCPCHRGNRGVPITRVRVERCPCHRGWEQRGITE